jgi:sortase A
MWNRSLNKLSLEELEELIRQRRAGVSSPILSGRATKTKQAASGRRQRQGREKALFLAEILLIAVLLAFFGISARGWMALRQQLPLDGIILLDEEVLANSPSENTPRSSLPPIGWRNSPLVDRVTLAETRPQIQPLETPEHLKRWLQPASNPPPLSIPDQVVRAATRIVIPSIGVDAPVGEGTDWESLKYKVGHQPGTANPGQRGNMVLAAHNDVYGELFRYLPDVPIGETITIYTGDEAFRYQISERRIITPDQVEVMLPTTGPTTTLISCYPYLIDTHRIVLFGELVE